MNCCGVSKWNLQINDYFYCGIMYVNFLFNIGRVDEKQWSLLLTRLCIGSRWTSQSHIEHSKLYTSLNG